MRPLLLDLFCGAGGCTKGYQRAGWRVVGVDIEPQPNYCGDEFVQMDALEALRALLAGGTIAGYRLEDFAAVHASPPCQAHSTLKSMWNAGVHVDLVPATREALVASGLPYVIENVVGAPLLSPVMLCGSSFGLRLRRHRLFESNIGLLVPPCDHSWQQASRVFPALDATGRKRGSRSGIVGVYGHGGDKRADLWPREMQIDWMTRDELTQAIPPVYTELIGHQLVQHVAAEAAA